MPAMVMEHVEDPKATLIREVGDLSDVEVFNNDVLVALYVRPEKTKSGIIITDKTRDEDKYQGKVGLIVKMGPKAFATGLNEDGQPDGWFEGDTFKVGDWVGFNVSNGWQIAVNKVPCRMLKDTSIRVRVQRPDSIW